MRYALSILPSVHKTMRRIPAATRRRIDERIEGLADDPRPHGCLKLSGVVDAYRVRAGITGSSTRLTTRGESWKWASSPTGRMRIERYNGNGGLIVRRMIREPGVAFQPAACPSWIDHELQTEMRRIS